MGKSLRRDPCPDDGSKHFVFVKECRCDKIPAVVLEIVAISGTVKGKRTAEFMLQNFHIPQNGLFAAVDFQLFLKSDTAKFFDQSFGVRITVLFQLKSLVRISSGVDCQLVQNGENIVINKR